MKYRIKTLLTIADLAKILGLAPATIRAKHNCNSNAYDPSFPRPIKLGGKSVRYYESEIIEWIESGRVDNTDELVQEGAA